MNRSADESRPDAADANSVLHHLAEYGLDLHPDKARLIEFERFAAADRS